jgi:outer membrane protein
MKPISKIVATLAVPLVLAIPHSAFSHEAGDIIVRLGATAVFPDESTTLISTTATGALAGTEAGVGNNTQLGLNLVYMLSNSLGVEVLAATPFEHDLEAKGLDAYGFATTGLGTTDHLPPTVTLNYFFGGANSLIRPYIGAGINYTTFFSKDLSNQAETELAARSLDLDDSYGVAYRAGVDFVLGDHWMLNASAWKIDIDTDVSFQSALGKVEVGAELDPWVYMISLGYKF